jgi:hypothetical protein
MKPEPEVTLPLRTLSATIETAHSFGLKTLLMPIVLLRNPRTVKDWRGMIAPTNIRRWFEAYRYMILKYARLAEERRVAYFSIGSELVSMERYVGEWARVIDDVRRVYSGKILYSFNWDHLDDHSVWRKLDLVGCSAYFELLKPGEPIDLERVRLRAQKAKAEIDAWSRKLDRPVILTEVGFPSRVGGLSNPWDHTARATPDMETQLIGYQTFLKTWSAPPFPYGIFFYEWTEKSGPLDDGYTPKGKPAEALLRNWLRQR